MSKNVVVGIVEEWGCELLEDKTRFLKRLILKWFQKPSSKVASAICTDSRGKNQQSLAMVGFLDSFASLLDPTDH